MIWSTIEKFDVNELLDASTDFGDSLFKLVEKQLKEMINDNPLIIEKEKYFESLKEYYKDKIQLEIEDMINGIIYDEFKDSDSQPTISIVEEKEFIETYTDSLEANIESASLQKTEDLNKVNNVLESHNFSISRIDNDEDSNRSILDASRGNEKYCITVSHYFNGNEVHIAHNSRVGKKNLKSICKEIKDLDGFSEVSSLKWS